LPAARFRPGAFFALTGLSLAIVGAAFGEALPA